VNEGGDGIDTVEVNGGNGAEQFTATANGARVRFDRVTPAPFSIDIGTTENLVVNMNAGDDRFDAFGSLAALIRLTVDGGPDNDTINGSNGNDVLFGATATTSSTATRATTSSCWERVTTPPSGTRATATTPSKGKTAGTRCCSTARTRARTPVGERAAAAAHQRRRGRDHRRERCRDGRRERSSAAPTRSPHWT
jgi:Ca2+-binding RTX toxin-like protein